VVVRVGEVRSDAGEIHPVEITLLAAPTDRLVVEIEPVGFDSVEPCVSDLIDAFRKRRVLEEEIEVPGELNHV
jgi:hypothetical protein